jgi:ribosomal protein S18 acetylase RimI-like enzyme
MSDLDLVIRSTQEDDLLVLSQFFARNNLPSVTRQFDPFPLTCETAFRITRVQHQDRYYVALLGSCLVGFAMLRGWDEGYSIPSLGILIDKSHHQSGYGRMMLQYVIKQAYAIGCFRIRLSVYASNSRALRLYQLHGFVEDERHPVFRDGVPDDKIIMHKDL